MEKNVEIRIKHWVYVDDTRFFGPGRLELLMLIDKTGSIAQAAKEMGMSYKKAWVMVNEMNTLGKAPYVVAKKGGTKGGGAEVTPTAWEVVKNYNEFTSKLKSLVEVEKKLLESI